MRLIAMPVSLCLFLGLLLGCAAVPLEAPGLPADKRAALGRVSAATGSFVPDELLKRPATKGEGAAAGAAGGAAAGAATGVYMSLLTGPFAPLFVVPFTVAGGAIGAGAGAVLGTVEGLPVAEVRSSGLVIEKAIEAERSQEAMLEAFMEEAGRRGVRLGRLEGMGPSGPSAAVSYMAAAGAADTVVEVSLIDFSLYGEGSFNPPLSLLVNARTRVVRTADDSVIFEKVFRCESLPRQFTKWAAEGARLVVEDAELCRRSMSRNIARAVFGPGK